MKGAAKKPKVPPATPLEGAINVFYVPGETQPLLLYVDIAGPNGEKKNTVGSGYIASATNCRIGNSPFELTLSIQYWPSKPGSQYALLQPLTKMTRVGKRISVILQSNWLCISIATHTPPLGSSSARKVVLESVPMQSLLKGVALHFSAECSVIVPGGRPAVPPKGIALSRVPSATPSTTAITPRRVLDYDMPLATPPSHSGLVVVNEVLSVDFDDPPWVKLIILAENRQNTNFSQALDVLGNIGINLRVQFVDPGEPAGGRTLRGKPLSSSQRVRNVVAREERRDGKAFLVIAFDRNGSFESVPRSTGVVVSGCNQMMVEDRYIVTLAVVRSATSLPTLAEVYVSVRSYMGRFANPMADLDMPSLRAYVQKEHAQPEQTRALKDLVWEATRKYVLEYFTPPADDGVPWDDAGGAAYA